MAMPYLDDKAVFQIAFVTDDIERTGRWLSQVLDTSMPGIVTTAPRSEAETEYHGAPSEARCKLAFFDMGNVTIELIEPDENPSCWRDFLDENGPGCHHLAFRIKGMKAKTIAFEKGGHPLLQRGEFTGGRYAYFDTEKQLGALVELLEFDDR